MMLAMNIFLAVPALAENYQEYGLYDSDGNYKGMFYSIEEINDFLQKIYYRKLIIFLEVLKCRQSLMFQGFPAFLVTEDVLKSP